MVYYINGYIKKGNSVYYNTGSHKDNIVDYSSDLIKKKAPW